MKLCRYNGAQIGLVFDDRVHDVTPVARAMVNEADSPRGDPLVCALPALREALSDFQYAGPGIAVSDVSLESPVVAPTKIVAAPVNYRKHIQEMLDSGLADSRTVTDIGQAGLFLKATSALVGASAGISVRFPERRTDHELEIVVVIGRIADRISAADALQYVAGYSLGLDITLRGPEDRSFRKSIDTYAVMGPWLTTADEVPDPGSLLFALDVDGVTRQEACTEDLVYDIPRLIAFASSFYTLYPGDLIYTGSPQGVGPIVAGNVLLARSASLGSMKVHVRGRGGKDDRA